MKKTLLIIILSVSIFMGSNINASAIEILPNAGSYETRFAEIENDAILDNAVMISEETAKNNGRTTTVKTYVLQDGAKLVDTFTRGDLSLTRSSSGSDTATRTRDLENWGSISLTASFSWRTEGIVSYVKCTSASSSKSGLESHAKVVSWNVTKTSGEVSIGTAKATLAYGLQNTQIPLQTTGGKFTITCDDTGAISDNG